MKPDLMPVLANVNTRGWKRVKVEFSGGPLKILVPPDCVELAMKKAERLKNPAAAVEASFDRPSGSPSLEEVIRNKKKPPAELQAAITVSDITRPVPYAGRGGILPPLLRRLEKAGLRRQNIRIIVGTGTHRASTRREKLEMFGEQIVASYRIQDHDCADPACLVAVGRTAAGTEVFLNGDFCRADLKIVTGLTESHFMAGVSGGRKAICPGLADLRTIQKFHSPDFLESPLATNLVLEGNPCHEEAVAVAKAAGPDFTITVTLDREMRLTGVFAGDLEKALDEAVRRIKSYVETPIEEEFDIVLTHAGYVGRNHYQTAKAAVGALPAVKEDGVIILAADNHDPEPIGGPEYKTLIHLLKMMGPDGYVSLLKSPAWKFTRDQWEPEVWGKVLRKIGAERLIYCTAQIPEETFAALPGVGGYEFLPPSRKKTSGPEKVRQMVQNALCYFYRSYRERNLSPRTAFITEGPYAVPVKH